MTAQHEDISQLSPGPEDGQPIGVTGTGASGDRISDTILDWTAELEQRPQRPRRRHHGVSRPVPPPAEPSTDGDLVQQTAMAVRTLTQGVNRFRGALADALEVSPTDVLALTEVALAPTITPGELADRIGVGIAGTSTVIDKLVRGGFLRRTPHPLDRRTYTLGLTPAGTHAVGWMWDATRAAIADAHTATTTDSNSDPASATPPTTTITALTALAGAYYRHADALAG